MGRQSKTEEFSMKINWYEIYTKYGFEYRPIAGGADNVIITTGSGNTIACDEVVDGTLGSCKVQYVKIMDGAIDATGKIGTIAGGLSVSIVNSSSLFSTIINSSNIAIVNSSALNITNTAFSVVNSSGWIMAQSNTVQNINIINSGGWVIAQSNTATAINIINSANWVIAVSNTAGRTVFATHESAQMSSSGVVLTPKFAVISASATDNTIVAAVATKAIRVIQMDMMSLVGVNGRFLSGVGGAVLTGFSFIGSNGGLVRPFSPVGWFQTATNTLLNLNLSAAQSVGGCLTYVEV